MWAMNKEQVSLEMQLSLALCKYKLLYAKLNLRLVALIIAEKSNTKNLTCTSDNRKEEE